MTFWLPEAEVNRHFREIAAQVNAPGTAVYMTSRVRLFTSVAFAYDDYPANCCGVYDCRPVPCDETRVGTEDYF
jgi:hypothetical protein